MPEDEEDIELDFSKIKNFFSRKKKDDVKEVESHAKQVEDKIKEKEKLHPDDPTLKAEEQRVKKIEAEAEKLEAQAEKVDDIDKAIDKRVKQEESELSEIEDDLESEIDLKQVWGKIKSLGKKAKSASKEEKEESDEVQVDWGRAWEITKKYNVLLLVLIPLILSLYLRGIPGSLPITDQWATDSVNEYFNNQIRDSINQRYPNLPDENKNILVAEELENFKKNSKDQYDAQVASTSEFFKSRLQDDSGQTYLIAIDPWFWFRHARNILVNGHAGDELVEGVEIDNHMLAPVGRVVPPDKFHAVLGAFAFKFLKIFNKDLSLLSVAFYLPMIITALGVIPAFFIASRFGGKFGGIIAGLIIAIHPSIMSRTTAGFSDTDGYNVVFPLLITWLFLLAFESDSKKKLTIYTLLAAFSVGLYSYAWSGWWHIFDFLMIATVGYLIYHIVARRSELKNITKFIKSKAVVNTIIVLVLFVVGSGIFVTFFTNYPTFVGGFYSPAGFTQIKAVGIVSAWPNVFTTVAEQNTVDIGGIIGQLGGRLLILIAMLGITLTLWSKKNPPWQEGGFLVASGVVYLVTLNYFLHDRTTFILGLGIPIALKFLWAMWKRDESIDVKYSIILSLWLFATIYASTKGIRWILLAASPFAIAVGLALGYFFHKSLVYMQKEFKIHKAITGVIFAIILLLLIGISPLPPFCKYGMCERGYNTALHEIPSMNDAWFSALDKINREASPDAIINSWWDFGHWFKAIGQRPTTFDGTTQNTPMAHFVGKALLTRDEQLAIGTLRMLDCGSYTSVGILENELGATYKAINLMRVTMKQDRDSALQTYKEAGLSNEIVDEVIELTHCVPPENYFITSDDMIGKSGVWSHFGIWDFDRATWYNQLYGAPRQEGISYLVDEFGFTKEDAGKMYAEIQTVDPNTGSNNWIAPWPSYASGLNGCSREENILTCINGFKINLDTNEAEVNTANGIQHPRRMSIATKDGIVIKEYPENYIALQNGRPLGLAVFPTDSSGSSWQTLFMDAELVGGMFTQLYFQDGHGLSCFEKFEQQRSSFGQNIIIWKVDWDCNSKSLQYLQN